MLASAMLANDSTYRSSFSKSGATATQTFPTLNIVCCISWWISLLQVNIKDTTKTMILSAALGLREKMWKNQRGTFCFGIPNYVRLSRPLYSPPWRRQIYESPNRPDKIKFWSSLSFRPSSQKLKKKIIFWFGFCANFASISSVTRNDFVKTSETCKTACAGYLAWISSDYFESFLLPQWEEKTTRSNRMNFRLLGNTHVRTG